METDRKDTWFRAIEEAGHVGAVLNVLRRYLAPNVDDEGDIHAQIIVEGALVHMKKLYDELDALDRYDDAAADAKRATKVGGVAETDASVERDHASVDLEADLDGDDADGAT